MKITVYENDQLVEKKLEDLFPKPLYRAPQTIFSNNKEFTLKRANDFKVLHNYTESTHSSIETARPTGLMLTSYQIESEFKREFIHPQGSVITQGRWECAPASLAMLLGESLWTVKRALAKIEWNNDDRGTTPQMCLTAAKNLGYNLIFTKDVNDNEPCLITVCSLNMKDKTHAVFWNGSEILDPNLYNTHRKHYSPEWTLNSLLRYPKVIRFKRPHEVGK